MSNKENVFIVEKSDKDKILDKIFWFKLIISLAVGVVYGFLSITGFLSFLLFAVGMTILSFVYFRRILNEDDEGDYQSEVFVEGLNVGIPVFLLSWTIVYTMNKFNTQSITM